jgi:hypothetical protein
MSSNFRHEKKIKTCSSKSSTCVICMELQDEYDPNVCHYPCGHIFHSECIHIWLSENNTCPSCRVIIDACQHGSLIQHKPYILQLVINVLKERLRKLNLENIELTDRITISSQRGFHFVDIDDNMVIQAMMVNMLQNLGPVIRSTYGEDIDDQ